MATLNLPTDPRTAVWALIKAQLQADSTYDAAGIRLVFFDGDREALADLASYQGPVLRFLPRVARGRWFDEASVSNALVVQVDAALTTMDVDDVFNLQGALESTLDTISDVAFQQSLVDAGAVTGLILFDTPLALAKPPQDGLFLLAGSFAADVRRGLT